jgi:hypothetical protein
MLLNIKALEDKSMDCAEVLVVTVVAWWGRNHELMFAESWGFHYQPPVAGEPKILGNRINSRGGNLLELLEQYHGVHLVPHDTKTAAVLDVVRRELAAGRPVIISIDSFWCPWDIGYLKHHNMHGCLVVGLEDDETSLYCIDGYYIKDVGRLPMSSFKQGCGPCATIAVSGEEKSDADWGEIVQNAVRRLSETDAFQEILAFAAEIESSLDLSAEGEGFENNFWDCPLIHQLLNIGRGRIQFANALRLLARRNQVNALLPLAERLEKVGWQWTTVRSMLIKEQMMPDPAVTISAVVGKIKEAVVEEESLARALLELCGRGSVEAAASLVPKMAIQVGGESGAIVFIDLSQHFNNHGVGSRLPNHCNADLIGTQTFILADSLPLEEIWTVGEMKFRFPRIADGVNDNISCSGQTICLPGGRYRKIIVLGCAECSNYSGRMPILYQDGVTEEIPLALTDWSFQPVFGETTAWVGKGAERVDGEVLPLSYEVHLYAQCYALKHDGVLMEIRLPDCPNLHVFAVSVV